MAVPDAAEFPPELYDELKRLAAVHFRRQPSSHTLQPTALAHEAFLRLGSDDAERWRGRVHFLATAARAMRQILVDHARRKASGKRGGPAARKVTLVDATAADLAPRADLLDLEEALARLAALDARQARVVELRLYAGLTVEEVAEALGVSRATVEVDWRFAKAWLQRELGA